MTTPKAHWSEKEQQYWVRDPNGGVLWFDSVLDAQAAARQIEIDIAVKAEREAIVAWLLAEISDYPRSEYSGFCAMIADSIKDEEHLK
jgi:hypothetical protein